MTSKMKTHVSWESLNEVVLPQIRQIFQEEFKKVDTKIEKLDEKIETYRIEVLGFKEEVMGEIKNLRDEVTIVNGQYRRVDSRTDKIEKHLGLIPASFG